MSTERIQYKQAKIPMKNKTKLSNVLSPVCILLMQRNMIVLDK